MTKQTEQRLRKFLPFFPKDGEGMTSHEVVQKILRPEAETKPITPEIQRLLDSIATDSGRREFDKLGQKKGIYGH